MVAAHPEPVKRAAPKPRFIYITGCDGAGKTTQARLLLEQLRSQGIKARQVWLRFPFLFSLPLLAYARWRGYSRHEASHGVRHGYWDFRSSRVMRHIFPWVLLADASIAALFKIYIHLWRGETVVCERFVFDMLVDLSLAFHDHSFMERIPGKLFFKLMPRKACLILLHLDLETIQKRRLDLVSDRLLKQRLKAFELLAARNHLPMLSTQNRIDEVNFQIQRLVGSEAEKESPGFTNKYAAQAPLPVLKSLLRYPICGVMAHWLLQGMHYLDRTELFFKIGFEVLATFVFYLILGVKLNHVPAFLLAIFLGHTVNFLFNAQLCVVLKHYGLVSHSESEFSAYTDELRTRILEEPSLRCAAVYGSCVRGAWRPSSDLDILLFREKGWVCGLRACVFLLRERTRALFSGFPLDMYVLDDDSYLSRLSPEEKPIILVKK